MPAKRKVTFGAQVRGKRSRTSKSAKSTPALTSSADLDDPVTVNEISPELNQAIAQNVEHFDIRAFPYTLEPGVVDQVSPCFDSSAGQDCTGLTLKDDQKNRPLWMDGNGNLTLECAHSLAPQIQDFLVTIAEPVSRPTFLHEYKLTTHSLYAAVSVGVGPQDIISTLGRFLKTEIPPNIVEFINQCGKSYGKVKMVLKNNRYFLESTDLAILQKLLQDPDIATCRVSHPEDVSNNSMLQTPNVPTATLVEAYDALNVDDEDSDDEVIVHSFQIQDDLVATVSKRCLALNYPALEEYDFRNDYLNADLDIDLKPTTQIRPYQEKGLSKMFGNGRAKSGIIVLPCGAGKTLVGVTAACTIKKGVVVLATSNMSALQWKSEFVKWSNVDPADVAVFSSESKSIFTGNTGVIITTYAMVTMTRERARDSARMLQFLQGREWGLMILDEVHVVPAQTFQRVIGSVKSHSKLGLTATLLREDDKIKDLNFLIGPKLYEANWTELSEQGHIAKVQCAEVWCPMTEAFYEHYLKAEDARDRSLLSVMNPNKFQACQYLIKYHENRGDKIIVFSDNIHALGTYAKQLMKPFLHGNTSNAERQEVLDYFKNSPDCSTLFLSKIGDTSLDLPEATVLIQISSQYGSRRQEAQRLGRILRAKRRNEEGFNAFFYSLVSKETTEMAFSSKRQAFLVDQGYAFKVITQLHHVEKTPDLAYNTFESQRQLLGQTLAEIQSKVSKKQEDKENKGLEADENIMYACDDRSKRKIAKPRGKAALGNKKARYAAKNPFFRKLDRENDRRKRISGEGED